jgi:nitrite reductase/ring-hydroxylating ferredoxin subunit
VKGFTKVCQLDDVPPGKGKLVRVGNREVHVYNREGRIYAALDETAARARTEAPLPNDPAPACQHPGSRFDVEQEDSRARVHAHTAAVRVRVWQEEVYVAVE